MKLLLLLAASAECARAAATLPPELLPASLSHAGLENPQSLTEVLDAIELRSLQDIRMLDGGERAEMFTSLQAMGVGLGSRAKLRRLAYASSAAAERALAQSTEGLEHADWAPTQAEATSTRRQLQDSGGSMDTIALAVTALLGIVSYFLQAKISRDAERSQKDSDRAHADNARAENKAEKLLTRVQVGYASTALTLHVFNATFMLQRVRGCSRRWSASWRRSTRRPPS
jgi:hypothetical protein